MNKFGFISHKAEVDAKVDQVVAQILTEWGQVAQGFATTNTPVDTGRLRGSITYEIDVDAGETVVGTNVEYAPYVEFNDKLHHNVGKAHFMRDCVRGHESVYHQIARSRFSQLK